MFRWRELARLLGLVHWPEVELSPRYNLAPTQLAPVARLDADHQREGVLLTWGISGRINVRTETFRRLNPRAWVGHRCLVPISGFYEWHTLPDGKTKQPYWIGREDRQPFVLAGVWEPPRTPQATTSFAILTTTPNDLMSGLHDRMPVLVSPEDFELWLFPKPFTDDEADRLLSPSPMPGFEAFPVSRAVNSPKNDSPDLTLRVDPPSPSQGFLF